MEDSRLEEMEERWSVERKHELNNPWAEGLEAGPGDSDRVFLRTSIAHHLVVESFLFGTEQPVSMKSLHLSV